MLALVPDVKEGSTLTFTYLPGKGTTLQVGNKELGVFEGKGFADAVSPYGWVRSRLLRSSGRGCSADGSAAKRKSLHSNHGQRVVVGQRLMQAASDSFLGWTQGKRGRHFYVRQLRDMKTVSDHRRHGP